MKILAIQNRMGIGDTVIFLPFIKALYKKYNSPISLLVKESSKADQYLYVCLRPIRYFNGVPSPVKRPQDTDMVIFRENSEDIYCGVEFEGNSTASKNLIKTLKKDFKVKKIRFDKNVGIGIKPISEQGTSRLVKKAIDYAIDNNRTSVTLVHKGNIMKYTEGAFRDWGYGLPNGWLYIKSWTQCNCF